MRIETEAGKGQAPETGARGLTTRTAFLHVAIISIAAFAAYAYSLRNGFVADDESEVLTDPLIRSFRQIGTLFAHSVWYFNGGKADRYYRPLKLLAYSIEYHLFHFRAVYWHLVNVLVHVAVVIGVYFLVRELAGGLLGAGPGAAEGNPGPAAEPERGKRAGNLAFWSALLFAVHPVHVEAVAWIAGGNDLFCGLCVVVALWAYHRARNGELPVAYFSLSALLFFAGLLFKETALTFPILVLCYDYFYRGKSAHRTLRGWTHYLAYVAALAAYLGMRLHALGGFGPNNPGLHVTGRQFALTVPVLAARYVWKSLVPVHLDSWYTFHAVSSLGWKPVAAGLLVAALVWAIFWLRRREPLLSLALAWFWLTLVPALDIPKLGDNVFAERYLYIPTVGFCLLAAWALLWMMERAQQPVTRRAAYAAAGILVAFYSLVAVRRLPDWHDDVSLWAKTARQDPGDPIALDAAGAAYYRQQRYAEAFHLFQRAVELAPDEAYTHNSLGGAYFAAGRYDDALHEYERAVALDPSTGEYWRNLGVAYANKRDWPNSVQAFQRADAIFSKTAAPAASKLYYASFSSFCVQYGTALLLDGQTDAAGGQYRRATQMDPANLDARIRLGSLLASQGQLDAAASLLVEGLAASPDSREAYLAHLDLSRIYRKKGMTAKSDEELQKALELNPTLGGAPVSVSPIRPAAGPAKGERH